MLNGGSGADTLIAGQNAVMTGGAGADVFWFTTPGTAASPDANRVNDFTHGTDKIAFSNAGFALGLAGASATPTALPTSLFSTEANGTFDNATERFAYNTGNGGSITTSRAIPPAARPNSSPPSSPQGNHRHRLRHRRSNRPVLRHLSRAGSPEPCRPS